MFSRLLHTTRSYFSIFSRRSPSITASSVSQPGLGPEHQLQTELAAAAEAAVATNKMVATRSQEPVVINGGLDDSVTANGTPKQDLKKRKPSDEQRDPKAGEARKKRKRAADFFESTLDQKRNPGMDGESASQRARQSFSSEFMGGSGDSADFYTSAESVQSPDLSAVGDSEDVSLEPEEQRILTSNEVEEVVSRPEVAVVVTAHESWLKSPNAVGLAQMAPPESKSRPSKEQEESMTSLHQPMIPSKSAPRQNGAHKRFNSAEPESFLTTKDTVPTVTTLALKEKDDGSDSDAAPETTTLATATSEAQVSRISAANAARMQKTQKRQKVKEREEARRLQSEAQEAKVLKIAKKEKRRKDLGMVAKINTPPLSISPPLTASTTLKGSPVHDKLSLRNRIMEIPEVLPMDVLTSVPAVRPPTPPPETLFSSRKSRELSTSSDLQKQTHQRKHIVLSAEKKLPKDIVRNGVRIRVLQEETERRTLAPKATKQSKQLREQWLKGRGAVERRPWGGAAKGFVRV